MTTVREHADDEHDRKTELGRLWEEWEQDAEALRVASIARNEAEDEFRRCQVAETTSRHKFEQHAKPQALRPVDPFLDDEGHQAREHATRCSVCGRRDSYRARGICDECKEHEERIGAEQVERESWTG